MSNKKVCSKCGEEKPLSEFYFRKDRDKYYSYCKKCHYKSTKKYKHKNKIKLAEKLGGECEKCGFNECYSVLEFHHINPENKEFSVGQASYNMSYEKLLKEAEKCMLLCANCHRMIDCTRSCCN